MGLRVVYLISALHIGIIGVYVFVWLFKSSYIGHMTSDEEQALMLKDYAHQIIILIIALRQVNLTVGAILC